MIEGLDGVGKTYFIENFLKARFPNALFLAFPGGAQGPSLELGVAIRKFLLLRNRNLEANTLLNAAAINLAIGEAIVPALQHGALVFLDRYLASYFVYSCRDDQGPLNYVRQDALPDLTILLDCSEEVMEARLESKDESFDQETAWMLRERYYHPILNSLTKDTIEIDTSNDTWIRDNQDLILNKIESLPGYVNALRKAKLATT